MKKSDKRGRKTKYDPEIFPQLAEAYARDGLSDKEIAAKLGIKLPTYYLYQSKFLDFFKAIKKGKEPVDLHVENALLKRALGYEYEEIHTEIFIKKTSDGLIEIPKSVHKIKKHVPPDVAAIAFWLTNRRPEKWKQTKVLDAKVTVDKEKKRISSLFPTQEEINDVLEDAGGDNEQ